MKRISGKKCSTGLEGEPPFAAAHAAGTGLVGGVAHRFDELLVRQDPSVTRAHRFFDPAIRVVHHLDVVVAG